MKTTVLFVLGALLLTRPAMAQLAPIVLPQNGQGMLTGISLGMQLEDSTGSRLRFRTPGTTTGSNQPWSPTIFGAPSPQHPDYSDQALFALWTPFISGASTPPPWSAVNPEHNPVFGDMSTGGDITPPVDASGTLQLGTSSNTAWYSLSFTVKAGTLGVPGSVFRQVAEPAGHVFSYTVPLSTTIRPDLVDTLRFEYTRNQLGLAATTTEITALDWGMGIISSGASGSPGVLQPIRTELYFTIDRTWWVTYGSTPGATGRTKRTVQVPGAAPFDLDPSVVYRMEWTNGAWSVPVIAFDQVDLYGQSLTIGADFGPAIDALSVDEPDPSANNWRVVFSLDSSSDLLGAAPPSEILVSQQGTGTAPTVTAARLSVRKAPGGAGNPVDGLIGIGPDEVTGLCGRDPKEGALIDRAVGTPVATVKDLDGSKSPLGLSLQRFDVPVSGKPGMTAPAVLFETHGINVPTNRTGVLVFEIELFHNPGMPLVLPISFNPKVLPIYSAVPPGAATHSVILPTVEKPGYHFRLRANLVLLGGHALEIKPSWVSTYSM